MGMMCPACQVDRNTFVPRSTAGRDRAANRPARSLNQLWRPGETDTADLFFAELTPHNSLLVICTVCKTDLIVIGWIWNK